MTFFKDIKHNSNLYEVIKIYTDNTPLPSPKQSKGKKREGFFSPNFKLYYKVEVIKTVWYWSKHNFRPVE